VRGRIADVDADRVAAVLLEDRAETTRHLGFQKEKELEEAVASAE